MANFEVARDWGWTKGRGKCGENYDPEGKTGPKPRRSVFAGKGRGSKFGYFLGNTTLEDLKLREKFLVPNER